MTNSVTKRAVDLFCGCGGISVGARLAGYDIVAGLDVEKNYISSFRHNFPKAHTVTDSIISLSAKDFAASVGIECGELDLLAGGPPCQGFSKNVPRKHRYLDDPKNLLVKSFLEYAEYLRPRVILMENVAEMKNGFDGQYTDEVVSRLESAGYTVSHAVLNAADYGVPQRRRRAFFLANRAGLTFRIPQATHLPKPTMPFLLDQSQHVSVWEAIGDLPSLEHGEGEDWTPYATNAQSEYQHIVRNANGAVRNHIARKLQPTQLERLSSIGPGQGHKDLPPHLQVKGGYSGAYARLTKDMIAPTITRWVFHPGSGRWGHPVDPRVLSIREVARVQGFPDSYEFVGTYTQQAGQLGNAVPPILAMKVIRDLDQQLTAYTDSSISTNRSKEIFSSSDGNRKEMA
jgi:DNA (cytosine-5)-methyltransferase 1